MFYESNDNIAFYVKQYLYYCLNIWYLGEYSYMTNALRFG